jgi:hypothetical protein
MKHLMPPVLTYCILIFLVSFVVIARGAFATNSEENSIPTLSNTIIVSGETELNTSEREVLSLLSSVVKLPNQKEQGKTTNYIYYNTLQEYLGSSEVYLNTHQAELIKDEIATMHAIMSSEEVTDFTKLSLDGKKVFIYISEQIYELCGLKLVSNMDGDIEKISDSSGNVIYAKKVSASQVGFQVNVLIVTVTVMVTLLSICFTIAKKNQLFIKEVIYDGFDEERFA